MNQLTLPQRRHVLKSLGATALGMGFTQLAHRKCTAAEIGTDPDEISQATRGTHNIDSKPVFLLVKDDKTEILVCEATLTVEISDVITTRGGKDKADVNIVSWTAIGRKPIVRDKNGDEIKKRNPNDILMPGAQIVFRSHPTLRTRSPSEVTYNILSNRSAFPAKMDLSINYFVEYFDPSGAKKVVNKKLRDGTSVATNKDPILGKAVSNISSIPPAPTDMFDIDEKGDFTIEDGGEEITVIPVACAC